MTLTILSFVLLQYNSTDHQCYYSTDHQYYYTIVNQYSVLSCIRVMLPLQESKDDLRTAVFFDSIAGAWILFVCLFSMFVSMGLSGLSNTVPLLLNIWLPSLYRGLCCVQ